MPESNYNFLRAVKPNFAIVKYILMLNSDLDYMTNCAPAGLCR